MLDCRTRRRTLATLVIVSAVMFSCSSRGNTDSQPVQEASLLLERGQIDEGIELLRSHLERHPRDSEARRLVGDVLTWDGKPDEAAEILMAGIDGSDSCYELWMDIGKIRYRQGIDGPGVTRYRGSVSFQTRVPEEECAAFQDEHLRLAAEAFEGAHGLRPDTPEPVEELAKIYHDAGEPERAVQRWAQLCQSFPDTARYHAGHAGVLKSLERYDEALEESERAVAIDPRLHGVHAILADLYEREGRPQDAKRHRHLEVFYAYIPGFIKLEYSDEAFEAIAKLQENAPGFLNLPRNETTAANRRDEIERLIGNRSSMSSALLAAICWRHQDHGGPEDAAFAELANRSDEGKRLILSIAENSQSSCTTNGAIRALAKVNAPEAFDMLIDILPRDTDALWQYDAATLLEDIGDPRAVPLLIEVMDPDYIEPSPESEPGSGPEEFVSTMSEGGRKANRGRCALALGAFSSDIGRAALEAGLENPDLGLYCHAALFRLTGKTEHLEPVEAALAEGSNTEIFEIIGWFERRKVPGTQDLIEAFDRMMEEESASD